jgi:hypothetical protein
MNAQIAVYGAYSVIAVGLITWLARNLGRHGSTFLEDVFPDKPELARAVNQLLVTGFFMLNLGYAAWLLKADRAADGTAAFEVLAQKLGLLLVSLAGIHFANVFVFWKIRRRQQIGELPPPVAPTMAAPQWNPSWPATGMAQ